MGFLCVEENGFLQTERTALNPIRFIGLHNIDVLLAKLKAELVESLPHPSKTYTYRIKLSSDVLYFDSLSVDSSFSLLCSRLHYETQFSVPFDTSASPTARAYMLPTSQERYKLTNPWPSKLALVPEFA